MEGGEVEAGEEAHRITIERGEEEVYQNLSRWEDDKQDSQRDLHQF
jgi:hypothetical protein